MATFQPHPEFRLFCIWNAANEYLENASTDPQYRRCREPATAVHEGHSFCDKHLLEHLQLKRERFQAKMKSMTDSLGEFERELRARRKP